MSATVIKSDATSIIIQVEIPLGESKGMLGKENLIQQGVNQAGLLATELALSQFDTDGNPITVDERKLTSKGQVPKAYQTPYGEVVLYRHVYLYFVRSTKYQSNAGGCTFCPLDNDARIIISSTPKLAQMVGSKYAETKGSFVQKDFKDNHGRHLSKQFIQSLSHSVGSLVAEKKTWNYKIDVPTKEVSAIGLSLDGTCMLICNDGYRQAMVGSISMYDSQGERLYSRYTAMSPEYGKERFKKAFELEITKVHKLFPQAKYIGIADGAADNWTFLQSHVEEQILDFYHASEYLSQVSKAAFKHEHQEKEWYEKVYKTLKDKKNGAKLVLKELKTLLKKHIKDKKKEIIKKAITYFENHLYQMDYFNFKYNQNNWPIGSGVIEAACKTIIKQRLCHSGMKWTDEGARTVLALRCFNKSDGMWEQFWNKIDRYGI